MSADKFSEVFTEDSLKRLFPESISDDFFEALYGDAEEGAYDISLSYAQCNGNQLEFELRLNQRPGKCLACNLTYGLPEVFNRHPLINIKGLVNGIDDLAGDLATCTDWKIGNTREISRELHIVPLTITIAA